MAMPIPSVEGPEFAERVRRADDIARRLEDSQWNFDQVPEVFARAAACDVVAKEMAYIHDGRMQTRIGRLIMMGEGEHFNLMGSESPLSVFRLAKQEDLLDEINRQIGSLGLDDIPGMRGMGRPERVDFYNFTLFYQPRDLVVWSALFDVGLYPTGFEIFLRHFAGGRLVHNVEFSPSVPGKNGERRLMAGPWLSLQSPTPVVEWMEKPIYGGMAKETIHIANLLTLEPTDVSHPYLPLVAEGKVEYGNHGYYLRRFVGTTPKDGLRGPDVPQEGPKLAGT